MEIAYPCLGLHFVVLLGSYSPGAPLGDHGSFQEVSGLSASMNTESYHEGGQNCFDYRLPTGVKYEPLKLTSGVLAIDRPLATWCRSALQGNFEVPIQPETLVLQLLDTESLLRAWTFYGAWPTRWEIAGFNSTDGKILVETLELGYNYFEPQSL